MNFSALVAPDTSFCTLTLFRFPKSEGLWAMKMMYYGHKMLNKEKGLIFYKLLGTGKGFGPLKPDLFRYGLFAIWKNALEAQAFFDRSEWISEYNRHSKSQSNILLQSYQSRGSWSGINPYQIYVEKPAADEPIAVLTRGSIKFLKTIPFWKHEPEISRTLKNADGLITSAGLGEFPLFRQVTFSIWESEKAMEKFAHGSSAHGKAAQAAFNYNYFSEWMFTRFRILAAEGDWQKLESPYQKRYL